MRTWYKYILDPSVKGIKYEGIDHVLDDHAKSMGGYDADESYQDKSAFFNKYLRDYHLGRLMNYDDFLRKHLRRDDRILSVASGRCANELFLIEDGYSIICADLGHMNSYQQTKALFPNFQFVELNILASPPSGKYDTIISLSLIYLFDDNELDTFFRNISASLTTNGHLILDSAGSPDNVFSYFIHDIWLKYEAYLVRLIKWLLRGILDGIVVKKFGYRRSDNEIISAAKNHDLELIAQENYAFIVEFTRSHFFSKLFLKYALRQGSLTNHLFNFLGRRIPYTRMFKFRKIS